jgi:putative ABC transport system permease protein
MVGIPAGIVLVAAVSHGATATVPPAWWLLAVMVGTLIAVAALSAIPAHIGARSAAAEILQAETA